MTIVLYELQPTRSARVRWTLLELGIPFKSIEGREVFAMPELAEIHPMSKLPALRDNGRPLFESAAICTWLADSHPEAGLIAPSGTWARALHDQWTAFTLAEVEANLWHTARNLFLYSDEERVPAVYEQNAREAKRGPGRSRRRLEGQNLAGRGPLLRHRHLRRLRSSLGPRPGDDGRPAECVGLCRADPGAAAMPV